MSDSKFSVLSSPHFVDIDRIPTFDVSYPLDEAYRLAISQPVSGFVVTRGTQPQYFVNSGSLARAMSRAGDPGSVRYGNFTGLRVARIGDDPVLREAVVPIEARAIETATEVETLATKKDGIWVVQQNRRNVGFYAGSAETFEILTKMPSFRCSNPKRPHSNERWGNGFCQYCPFPLI